MPYNPRPLVPYQSQKRPGFSDAFSQAAGSALANALVGVPASLLTSVLSEGAKTAMMPESERRRLEAEARIREIQAQFDEETFGNRAEALPLDLQQKRENIAATRAGTSFTGAQELAARSGIVRDDKRLGLSEREQGLSERRFAESELPVSRAQAGLMGEQAKSQSNNRMLDWERLGFDQQKWEDQKNAMARNAAAAAANRGKTEAEKQRLEFEKKVGTTLADYQKALAAKGESAWVKDKDGNDVQVSKLTKAQQAVLQTQLAALTDLEQQALALGYKDLSASLRRQLKPTAKPEKIGDGYRFTLRPEVTSTDLGVKPKSPQDELARLELAYRNETDPIRKARLNAEIKKFEAEALAQEAYAKRLSLVEGVDKAAKDAKEKKGKKEPALKTGAGKGLNATMSEFGDGE